MEVPTKPLFSINLENVGTEAETVHSVSPEERLRLELAFKELKRKVEQEGYEMNLEDQRLVVQWLRVDRETKFILNSKPVKVVKERVAREPKEPKVKLPKKLSQKALGLLYLKEMQGVPLTEDELRNKNFTLGVENE
jgi:hypothetical protein